jgi:hypothetical protein
MQLKELIVTKANGDQVLFSLEKLKSSMRRAGAEDEIIEKIVHQISPELYQGITTKKIYRLAFNLLKKQSKNVAAKYKLKTAIMELGPDGFNFEKFVAEIFKRKNYKTKIGLIVTGKCVKHEIDVLATTEAEQLLVECKYHSQPGKVSDVKVPLYIHSRFRDVEAKWKEDPQLTSRKMEVHVVTNTRFSPDAMQYARCSDMHLLGWDYPAGKGIKDLIDEFRLYPVTCLTSLSSTEKNQLISQGAILCSDLLKSPELFNSIRLSQQRSKNIMNEVRSLVIESPPLKPNA